MTTFDTQHMGLYLSSEEIARTEAKKYAPEFVDAWAQLEAPPPTDDALVATVWYASQYRLGQDANAGEHTIHHLISGIGWEADAKPVNAMRRTLASIHAFELVREHPAWQGRKGHWLDGLQAHLQRFTDLTDPRPLELLWQIPLKIASAIALEDATLFDAGCASFEHAIKDNLHPEGYLKTLVMMKDGKTFQRQHSGITALVLAAEAATHAGRNLWEYEDRSVSLATGIAYQVYYYFFPEKWRWEETGTYTEASMRDAFQRGGAYLEIGGLRTRPRSLEMLLEETRPMLDSLGGGFTTLTHGIELVSDKRKKRRNLLGRGDKE